MQEKPNESAASTKSSSPIDPVKDKKLDIKDKSTAERPREIKAKEKQEKSV